MRELERVRDDCLVAIMQALRSAGYGAGACSRDYEQRRCSTRAPRRPRPSRPSRRCACTRRPIPTGVGRLQRPHERQPLPAAFGDATDALLRHDRRRRRVPRGGRSYFTVETHLAYLRERRPARRCWSTTQLLGHDDKRLHLFHRLLRGARRRRLATAEQLLLHVDTDARRAAPAGPEVLARIAALAERHAALERPASAGRGIALERRGPAA